MDIVDRIELLDGMSETNEEKDNHNLRICYLVDLLNPFVKFDDCGFQTRFRFSKLALQHLFNIIRNNHELLCANNAVPETLLLLLCLRFQRKGHFQQTDCYLMKISRQNAGVAASCALPS